MGGFGYSPTFAGRRPLLRPRTGALRWQGTVHGKGEEGGNARAGALAAADEGVRRGARGGRAPPSFLETSTRASTMYHDIFRILTRLVQW